MSDVVVCHGCGRPLDIPEDYARNKIQCPDCGVFCPVAARPAARKARPAEEPPLAEEPGLEDEPRLEDVPEPTARPAPPPLADDSIVAEAGVAACRNCGELVRVPARKRGRRGQCPNCGSDWEAPAAPPRKPKTEAPAFVPPPVKDEFAGSSPDEDPDSSNPYRTADPGRRRCPGCSIGLEADAVVCVRCGFDLRTGKKLTKTYKPLDISWDSGPPWQLRVAAFGLGQVVALVACYALFVGVGEAGPFVFAWLVWTGMTSFLLGTFDHVDLKRNRSGRVTLVKRWRICFVPLAPVDVDVRDHDGVLNGRENHAGFWEWLVLFALLPSLVPAALWWYCTMYKIVYYVALTSDHGNPEVYVYRGWSEERMLEIEQTLRDAAGYSS